MPIVRTREHLIINGKQYPVGHIQQTLKYLSHAGNAWGVRLDSHTTIKIIKKEERHRTNHFTIYRHFPRFAVGARIRIDNYTMLPSALINLCGPFEDVRPQHPFMSIDTTNTTNRHKHLCLA